MQNKNKIHWIGWQKLICDKKLGGIGFKDLVCFNQALLAKQAWRLMTDHQSLLYSIFKTRYFLNTNFLSATLGSRPSNAWRSILFGRELILAGLKRVIGNGLDTNVWIDKWLFEENARRPVNLQSLMNINLKVHELIDPLTRTWNVALLRDLFPLNDDNLIMKQQPWSEIDDFYCWAGTNNRVYNVKTGYELSSKRAHKRLFFEAGEFPSINPILDNIWLLKISSKIQVFLWKAVKGAIAVEDRLRSRGIHVNDGCYMCAEEFETVNHILFQCPVARQVWALSNVPSPCEGFGSSVFTNMYHLL